MRAEPAAQLRLLDLQDLDTALDRLAHRRRSVPQIAELAELEQRGTALRDRHVAVRTVASDLERDVARAENEVALVRARIARDQDLLDSGSVASARQLNDLQHEVESLRRRVASLEDAELEVMERLEEAQTRTGALALELAELDTLRTTAETARATAFHDLDLEAQRVLAERARVAPDVPSDVLAVYQRMRDEHGGIGAAPLYRGRCQGCQLTLTPSDIARIRMADPGEVQRCEECRRILVRTDESGL